MAEGLKIEPKNVLSRMLSDEKADIVFRLNHYPPCSDSDPNPNSDLNNRSMSHGRTSIGFGEHTDPQLISIARSNAASGFQIYLEDGTWVGVPPDETSYFINVDDLLEVILSFKIDTYNSHILPLTSLTQENK